jgi:hypothetical protein
VPRRNYPRKRTTTEIKSLFTNVATTNHFEFQLLAFPTGLLNYVQAKEPLLSRYFLTRELNLLCKGAELPGAAFATAQIKGNYMGIVQKYAHTRVFTDSSFTFIVDKNYLVLKFFQLWQEFIASGGEVSQDKRAYYSRMLFPDNYKCSQMGVSKFDKDHFQKIDYTFINAFPVNIVPSAVDYGTNRVLEITVTFSYDRYVLGSIGSLDTRSDQREVSTQWSVEDKKEYERTTGREYSSDPNGDSGLAAKTDQNNPPRDQPLEVIPFRP